MPEMILKHSVILNPTRNRTPELSGTDTHQTIQKLPFWLNGVLEYNARIQYS